MKSKVINLMIFVLFTGLVSHAQEIKFAGTADKKFDGSKIVLYNRATGDHDSAVIKDGRFVFTLSFKEPTRYFFYSDLEQKTKGRYFPYGILVTEPGTVNINADIENFANSTIKAGNENTLSNSFVKVSRRAQKKIINALTQKNGGALVNNHQADTPETRDKQLMLSWLISGRPAVVPAVRKVQIW